MSAQPVYPRLVAVLYNAQNVAKGAEMAEHPAHECCRPKRTELVWEGKRTQVERVALPFQVVETINISLATRFLARRFRP